MEQPNDPTDRDRPKVDEESHEQEHLMALQAKVGVALTSAGTMRQVLEQCAQALVDHLDAAFARIWTLNEATAVLELQASAGMYTHLDGPHARVAVGAFKIGKIAEDRLPHLTNDVPNDPAVGDRAWAKREGMVSFAGYPLLIGDRLVGVVALFSRRAMSQARLFAVQAAATGLAVGIGRIRADESLRASEAWLATTLRSIGDAVIATDGEGRVVFLNAVACALTGWTSEEARGRPLDEVFAIFNEQTRLPVESPLTKALREGRIVGLANHTVLVRRDGTETAIEDSAAPIRKVLAGEGSEVSGVVLVFRDATEVRKAAIERERHLAEEQRAHAAAEASRARYHSLFMQAPAPICILEGPEHRFTLANPPYTKLVGRDDIVGKTVADALPEVVEQGFIAILDRVYSTGEAFHGNELPIRFERRVAGQLEDGVLNFVYEPFRDLQDCICGILVVAFDVTDVVLARRAIEREHVQERQARQVAEHARERSEFLVRAAEMLSQSLTVEAICTRIAALIVPSMVDFSTVWMLRPDGDLHRLAVAPAGYVETGPALRVSPRAPNFSPEHAFRKLIAGNEVLVTDDYCGWVSKDSPPEYVEAVRTIGLRRVALIPLHAYGRSVGLFAAAMIGSGRELDDAMVKDLEAFGRLAAVALENGRLFEDTERLRRRAEDANLAKDSFLATVSHELRTPLTSILGWAKIIRADKIDGDMLHRGLEVIERNAKAQAQLIEDLLDVSRIVAGKLRLEPTSVFVSTSVESALESSRPAAAAKGIRLEAQVDPSVGAIEADPHRLQQVIWNLVSNAVKFTPRGGLVRVAAKRLERDVEISVTDTGEGIAAEFLPKVFERFRQAHQGAYRAGGLGLGLAIVRHLVEQHGGHVFAESDGLGKGARFIVRLPAVAVVAHPPDHDAHPSAPRQPTPRVLDRVRVLVVDDEDDARDLVVTFLQRAGATATGASSVDEALAAFHPNEIDAVVSDIGMPGRDGYALVKELRGLERPLGRRIPIIALTAFARSDDRTRALAAGFTTHVPKPLEPIELVMVLANALGRDVSPSRPS